MEKEKSIIVDLYLTRTRATLLILTLLLCSGLVYLVWGQTQAAAFSPQAPAVTSLRQYYLTTAYYGGDQPKNAGVCATGYHFASFWEIAQTATLKYNTTLGANLADSGQGPPYLRGWVRTGAASTNSNTFPPGTVNCANWTSAYGVGTRAGPSDDWRGDPSINPTFLGWYVSTFNCSSSQQVWCVED